MHWALEERKKLIARKRKRWSQKQKHWRNLQPPWQKGVQRHPCQKEPWKKPCQKVQKKESHGRGLHGPKQRRHLGELTSVEATSQMPWQKIAGWLWNAHWKGTWGIWMFWERFMRSWRQSILQRKRLSNWGLSWKGACEASLPWQKVWLNPFYFCLHLKPQPGTCCFDKKQLLWQKAVLCMGYRCIRCTAPSSCQKGCWLQQWWKSNW